MTARVLAKQRHRRAHPCPICGGFDEAPRGKGKRCSGFTSAEGEWCHCSREELAGLIGPNDAGLFAHKMRGACRCGKTHREAASRPREIEAVYEYVDEKGRRLFQVVRYIGKIFRLRRPDGAGGWVWKLDDTPRVPYRLRDLVTDTTDRVVYVVEGEKDADSLAKRGLLATCNPGGAGISKWNAVASIAERVLRGRNVVVIADRDDPGRAHAAHVGESLRRSARSVRVVECLKGKDITDHFGAGGTLDELAPVVESSTPVAVSTAAEPSSTDPTIPWASRVTSVPTAWYSTSPPRRKWLLRDARDPAMRGVLPLGKTGQLIGAGGASKTMMLCQLAVAVSTGTRWLGAFEVATKGRVLLVLGEEDADECHRRLFRAARAAHARPDDGAIVVLPLAGMACPMVEDDGAANLRDAPFSIWLREYVRAEGFVFVGIDPLSRFGGRAAEVDNAAATRFVQALEATATTSGATVLNVHHTNQASRNAGRVTAVSGRGVTGLVDAARWQGALDVEELRFDTVEDRRRLGEIVTFSVTKSNYAAKPAPVVLRRDQDNGGALVPLDDTDHELIRGARRSRGRSVTRANHAEDDARRASRDDDAARAILTEHGGQRPTWRECYAEMRARLGPCSKERVDAAFARVSR